MAKAASPIEGAPCVAHLLPSVFEVNSWTRRCHKSSGQKRWPGAPEWCRPLLDRCQLGSEMCSVDGSWPRLVDQMGPCEGFSAPHHLTVRRLPGRCAPATSWQASKCCSVPVRGETRTHRKQCDTHTHTHKHIYALLRSTPVAGQWFRWAQSSDCSRQTRWMMSPFGVDEVGHDWRSWSSTMAISTDPQIPEAEKIWDLRRM